MFYRNIISFLLCTTTFIVIIINQKKILALDTFSAAFIDFCAFCFLIAGFVFFYKALGQNIKEPKTSSILPTSNGSDPCKHHKKCVVIEPENCSSDPWMKFNNIS